MAIRKIESEGQWLKMILMQHGSVSVDIIKKMIFTVPVVALNLLQVVIAANVKKRQWILKTNKITIIQIILIQMRGKQWLSGG
jgi:predicted membrane chloride channel (bestrophin family)